MTDDSGRPPVDRSGRPVPKTTRPSASARAVPLVTTFLGVVIVAATQAVQRGFLTGVTIEWPAYLVGGALILLGIAGVGRREESAAPPEPEKGPIRESGYDGGEPDEEARLRAILEKIERERNPRSN